MEIKKKNNKVETENHCVNQYVFDAKWNITAFSYNWTPGETDRKKKQSKRTHESHSQNKKNNTYFLFYSNCTDSFFLLFYFLKSFDDWHRNVNFFSLCFENTKIGILRTKTLSSTFYVNYFLCCYSIHDFSFSSFF